MQMLEGNKYKIITLLLIISGLIVKGLSGDVLICLGGLTYGVVSFIKKEITLKGPAIKGLTAQIFAVIIICISISALFIL